MENQEIYNISGEVKKVTISHKKELDEQKPLKINVAGNIDSPAKWLEKRIIDVNSHNPLSKVANNVEQLASHIVINRDLKEIKLVFNETDPLYQGEVAGKLEEHPDFKKWKINTGESWNHEELSEFIKMNRNCFKSKQDAMKLSGELKTLKVKVDKEVEASNDNRGNVRAMLAQNVVESSIPKTFKLVVPVFKGQSIQEFEIEIYVNPNNFQVTLVSPDASDIIAEVRDTIFDEQKKRITEVAPLIVIIEQ